MSTCACVIQLQRCRASSRPTPNTATASPWSSARLPGQPATSWGRSHWTAASSLRRWWAAPLAPSCSCSPTPATGWASCQSTLGGRASLPTPSRPGQVTSSTPNICPSPAMNTEMLLIKHEGNIHQSITKNNQSCLTSTFTCTQPPCRSSWLLQLRESEM